MGKTSAVKSVGKQLGNIVLHTLLIAHTNKPESKHHLESEEIEYRNTVLKEAREYHWNERDKKKLEDIALSFIRLKHMKKYSDVQFSMHEAEVLVRKEIQNFGL